MRGKFVFELLQRHGELMVRVDGEVYEIHLHNTNYEPGVDALVVDSGDGRYWIFGDAIQAVWFHREIKK